MDIKTGLSILNKKWLVEPSAAMQMLDFWEKVKAGNTTWGWNKAMGGNEGETEVNTLSNKFFALGENIVVCPENYSQLRDFKGFEGASIAVIPISGPLMKSDYCGWFGTDSMRKMTMQAAQSQSIHTIIFDIDTPGGTVDGTEPFANAIKNCGKRTIGIVNGMMCSAGMWIGSSCDELYASSKTDCIGSIGVMCSFMDYTEYYKEMGIILREYYATESEDKNKPFNEAKKGNGKLLIQQELDPINDVFMSTIKENRGDKLNLKKENVLTGKTYLAEEAQKYGLIDGIKCMDEVISEVLNPMPETDNETNNYNNNTSNKHTMSVITTLAELQSSHPTIYNEAVEIGVTKERNRVAGWQAWSSVDAQAVADGIASGKEVDARVISEMSAKAANDAAKKVLEKDNAEVVETTELDAKDKKDADSELEANKAALLAHMNIGVKK